MKKVLLSAILFSGMTASYAQSGGGQIQKPERPKVELKESSKEAQTSKSETSSSNHVQKSGDTGRRAQVKAKTNTGGKNSNAPQRIYTLEEKKAKKNESNK